MSAADFRSLFNNPAFSFWYKKEQDAKNKDTTSFIGIGREDSKGFVNKSVGDFILSREQLSSIFNPEAASKMLKSAQEDISNFDTVRYQNSAGQEQLVFPDIKFSSATKEVTRILGTLDKEISSGYVVDKVSKYFEANPTDVGHVFGFSNTLLSRAKINARDSLTKAANSSLNSATRVGDAKGIIEAENYLKDTTKQLEALDQFIDAMVDVLEEYDAKSSPIKGLDLEINTKYRKTATNWLFTWEGRVGNQESGRNLATILGTIKQTKIGSGVRGLFASLKNKASDPEKVLKAFIDDFITKSITSNNDKLNLLKIKSSPSMEALIIDSVMQSLGNKAELKSTYSDSTSLKNISLLNIVKSKSTAGELNKLKILKAKIATTKSSIDKQKNKLNVTKVSGSTSVIDLESILRARINQQVLQNMGSGSDTRILNRRTGRLAESVGIERLSESRAGLISVFYSYMKNPYATFSEGGRQQYPRTRDPKLLISKSIREIAAPIVGNRLRSVVV